MTWNNLLKEREALQFSSEIYKVTVIKYLQMQGYSLKSSSTMEGHLADLIMEKRGGPDLWVESKNTPVSLFEMKFRQQLLKYLGEWLRRPKEKRFLLSIFASEIRRPEDTQKILTYKATYQDSIDWFNAGKDIELPEDIKDLVLNAKENEIVQFLHSISVTIGRYYDLDEINRERERELRKSPNKIAARLLREIRNRRSPILKRSRTVLNFIELSFPTTFWEMEAKYKLNKTIYEKAAENGIERLPVFTIPRFESEIPVLRTFDNNITLLRPYITGPPVQKDFESLDDQRKRELVNVHLNRWLWCKGLIRNRSDYFFPYPNLNKEAGAVGNPPIEIESPKGMKRVTRALFRKDDSFNFVEHRSVEIGFGILEGKYGIFLWPGFLFTPDGITKIEGRIASKISARYLNPLFNHNSNKKGELKFWEFFLRNGKFVREKDNWFTGFYLKELRSEMVGWSSETLSLNLERITNYF